MEGRGVVAAANYEARKFGVHSAMVAGKALRLCPHAIVIKPRLDYYAAVAREIREIFERFTPVIEPLSLDEAFLDTTGSESLFGSALEIGRRIKEQIRTEIGLVASVGIAPNKFIAKIASDVQKPDGLVLVESDQIQSFLDPLPVSRLWGVGRVTGQVFERFAIRSIGQLREISQDTLRQWFGDAGEHYWKLSHGIDDRPVVADREAKSISNETTFAEDIADAEVLQAWLVELVEQVGRRLRSNHLKGRTVELKVRFSDFKTISRSLTLDSPTNLTQELLNAGFELLTKRLPPQHLPVRLLGFGVQKLEGESAIQQSLFDQQERQKNRELDQVSDQITTKFGKLAIRRGKGMGKERK